MKKVVCSGPDCQDRRIHWCDPDKPRGFQMVQVTDDWPDDRPAFCSMTCAILGGFMKMSCDNPCPKCKAQGVMVEHHGDYKCWQPDPFATKSGE